jgi:hypothetical protein
MGNIDSETSVLKAYNIHDLNITYLWNINKGIKSIKNDAFDVQFQDSVILGSGNVMVDALIAPYKRFNLKAI